MSNTRRQRGTPSLPRERPWVGPRFLRALLIAVPLAIGLWLGVAWVISQLVF
jgi:hypothetical protein